MKYIVSFDGDPSSAEKYETSSPREAAELFIQHHAFEAPWKTARETTWDLVHVYPTRGGKKSHCRECHGTGHVDEEIYTIISHPRAPDCHDGMDHEWQAPIKLVGQPIPHDGGGTFCTASCARCGIYRILDTLTTEPEIRGSITIRYAPADERSLAWVKMLTHK